MKYVAHIITAIIWTGTIYAQEYPLWPEGKTPYALSIDGETGSPLVTVYPSHRRDNHTGAAVVICPGGGYGGLAKDHEGHQPATWFLQQGVTAIVLQYRLGKEGHHYPTQLADVQRAIRWTRSQAEELKLDAKRIAVMGFSAGGHLASMAATLYEESAYAPTDLLDKLSARPDFAILCYPVISMDWEVSHGGSRKNLFGPDRVNDDELAKKLSSNLNVTEDTPPTFLFQTNEDAAVPAENATLMFLALREHGVPVEYHVYQNGPHGVGLYRGDPVLGTWSEHLAAWLKTNFFYSPEVDRAAVKGTANLDGHPVAWGVLTFYPENSNLPPTSIRIRRGKFSATEVVGPVVGKARVTFEGSVWETTGADEDKVVRLSTLSPKDEQPIEIKIEAGAQPISLEFRSR